MNYLVDYHIHSNHSPDGHNSIMELCESALRNGLREIAVTDHFEPSVKDEYSLFYDQKSYWSDMVKARKAFKGKLNIKLGVELGQPHLFPKPSEAILSNFPYDYVIASVHKLPAGMDVSEIDYRDVSEEEICEIYLKQLLNLIKWNNFDCVGHLDLIKRYSAAVYGKNLTLTCCYELLKEVLQLVVESGKGIEINTSGLRQTPKETMPGLDVLKLYKKLGGEILTVGSDAHYEGDLGKGIAEAVELAREAGFQYITLFNGRTPEWIGIAKGKNTLSSEKQIINR